MEVYKRGYSDGQTFCTAHTQVYKRVQLLEIELFAKGEEIARLERERDERTQPEASWRESELVDLNNKLAKLNIQARERAEQAERTIAELREALEATLRQLTTITHNWIEDDINNVVKEQASAALANLNILKQELKAKKD